MTDEPSVAERYRNHTRKAENAASSAGKQVSGMSDRLALAQLHADLARNAILDGIQYELSEINRKMGPT